MIAKKSGLLVAVMLEIARLAAIIVLCLTIFETLTNIAFCNDLLGTLCHQIPERCFSIAGRPIAICARCSGIYLGLVLGKCFFPRLRWLFWFMLIISVPEVTMHFMGIDFPNPIRFISGYGMATAIYLTLSRISWKMPKHLMPEVKLG